MTAILAIETSCDETAAAVVVDGREVLSSVVSSQIDLHAAFGGVVPEVAGRAHVDLLTPVVTEALSRAGVEGRELDAVGATIGPGLIGSLLVGVSAAKAYSLAWGVPFVGVNHMEGHLHAAFLEDPDMALPAVVLLVSGGHTMLIHMTAEGRYRLLGQTIDDAAGEAFDKVARFLGLGYPGGPVIDRLAADGDPSLVSFPRGLRGQGYDFSFSGLKTSVINYVRKNPDVAVEDVAACFQEAVVDVLVEKLRAAAAEVDARSMCIGGGVAANSALRQAVVNAGSADGRAAFIPSRAMCTDN
ncbi:MAG TPA: tRNA (adenosine(37)-N6)-threonylcarbamoyltransferase complex transferase subunit TsaD, partial [Acidimicrobiales bacterium]|nr:tRNA (adenosine(37)-N6)-threonylcarbamoyltransferase complex transferase subunit TsaD [Acidimicrobiales bacterium]